LESLSDFEQRALSFLEGHAQRRRAEQAELDFTKAPVSLFAGHGERDDILKARAWREAKFDAGFGWICGPVEYGGAGLPAAFEIAYDHLESLFDCPNDDPFTPGLEFVGPSILKFGQEDARAELLPAIYRGDVICCQLFSEPDAGSDLAALRTRAAREGENWVINGQKVWTSRAHVADIGLLLARTGTNESRHRGITAFVIDLHAPGVTVRPLRQMTGDAPFNEVFLDRVAVPDYRRLGSVDEGWRVAMATLASERAAISRSERYRPGGLAEVAAPERLLALAELCGLRSDPVIRQELAASYIRHMTIKWTVARFRLLADSDPVSSAAPGIGKLLVARHLSAAAELVGRLLGARLMATTGNPWSDNWVPFVLGVPGIHIGGGTDEVVLNSIAERAMGLPREKRPDVASAELGHSDASNPGRR
jgi:alkylation response protein AidB-like acyl-CoA dehydrogenase